MVRFLPTFTDVDGQQLVGEVSEGDDEAARRREVEATREKIAARYGCDVRKIAGYLRERAAKRRTTRMERKSASHTREGST